MNTKILITSLLAIALIGSTAYVVYNKESNLSDSFEYLPVKVSVDPDHSDEDLTCDTCY